MNPQSVCRAEDGPGLLDAAIQRPTGLNGGLLLRQLVRRLLLLWWYRLWRLRSQLPTRRNRETLGRSRLLLLLLLLLLALQLLQELFRSLYHRLTVWLLLLFVSLSVLVGWLILLPSGVVRELFVHLLGFLPRRNHTRWHSWLPRNRLLPGIPQCRRRGFRRAPCFMGQDYTVECVRIRS